MKSKVKWNAKIITRLSSYPHHYGCCCFKYYFINIFVSVNCLFFVYALSSSNTQIVTNFLFSTYQPTSFLHPQMFTTRILYCSILWIYCQSWHLMPHISEAKENDFRKYQIHHWLGIHEKSIILWFLFSRQCFTSGCCKQT